MFFRGERRGHEVPKVRIEDTPLEAYRYANWDPYVLLDDISEASLAAGAEGRHLWVSTEQLQMIAAATWLASSRQSMGHTLVGRNEEKSRLPSDVANMALANYQSAQAWLEYREDVKHIAHLQFVLSPFDKKP